MKSYRLELKPSRRGASGLAAAAAQLTRTVASVRCIRSEYSPEDGTCALIVEGETAEAVVEAGRRAQLDVYWIQETRSER